MHAVNCLLVVDFIALVTALIRYLNFQEIYRGTILAFKEKELFNSVFFDKNIGATLYQQRYFYIL